MLRLCCPDRDQLQRLTRGLADAAEMELFEVHLEQCDPCFAAVRELNLDDPLLEAMRAAARTAALLPSPAVVAPIVARLHQLPTGRVTQRMVGEPTLPETAHTLPALDDSFEYEILEQLGRGGQGVVFKARQTRLKRLVALKMLLDDSYSRPERRARFRLEAEAVARLQHPNIVQIFEVGEHQGKLFCVLEFVDGGSLAQKLNGRPLPSLVAARLLEVLARAVQAAHQAGIVHRDLKPANVLLDAQGEPKVTDFGLAKRLDQQGVSVTGELMGTPSYMAPEQADSRGAPVGPATDVYALGAVLYECLTGRPPFQGATWLETLERVQRAEPVPPSRLELATPRDLETICLKCLHKNPERRYASAAALAEDLRRCRAHEPILARPTSAWERAWKWTRRHPAPAGLLALVVLTLVVLPVALLWHNARLQDAFDVADGERQRAEQLAENTRQQLYVGDMRLGFQLLREGLVHDLGDVLERHRPESGSLVDRRGFEWYHLNAQAPRRQTLFRPPVEAKPVLLAYAPDGRSLVGAFQGLPTEPSWLIAWDRDTSSVRWSIPLEPHPAIQPLVAVLSPDARIVVVLSLHRDVVVAYDVASGKEIRRQPLPIHSRHLAFGPDNRLFMVGDGEQIPLWDLDANKLLLRLPVQYETRNVQAFALTPDGRTLLAVRTPGLLSWWDVATGRQLGGQHLEHMASSLAHSPDGKWLAVSDPSRGIFLSRTDVRYGRLLPDSIAGAPALTFSPDGRTLAASGGAVVQLWDVASRQLRRTLHWQRLGIVRLAFSPDGRELAAGTSDGAVHRLALDAPPGMVSLEPAHRAAGTGQLVFAPDGKTLAVAAPHCDVQLFDVQSGRRRALLETPGGEVTQLAYSADGRLLVTRNTANAVQLWQPETGRLLRTLPTPSLGNPVALDPTGKWLALREDLENYSGTLWDCATGQHRAILLGNSRPLQAMTFSPDGRTLVTSSVSRVTELWDVTQAGTSDAGPVVLKPFAELRHDEVVTAVAIAPDGRTLATAAEMEGVRLWSLQDRASPRALGQLEHAEVSRLQFSTDGRFLMTASPKSCGIWNVNENFSRYAVGGGPNWLPGAALSPDGRTLATAGALQGVQLWDLATWKARTLGDEALWDVRSLALAPDGQTLFCGSRLPLCVASTRRLLSAPLVKDRVALFESIATRTVSDAVTIWDIRAGVQRSVPTGPPTLAAPEHVVLSRDGRTLAAGSRDGSVWIADASPFRWRRRLFASPAAEEFVKGVELANAVAGTSNPLYPEAVQALDLSPDGQTLALASSRGTVALWNVAAGSRQHTLAEMSTSSNWIRFSPDGRTLAFQRGGQVQLWDVSAARLATTLGAVDDAPSLCAAFSSDGCLLVCGTLNHTLRCWDVPARRETAPLTGHLGRLNAVAFAPDGKTLASAGGDGTLRLWNVAARQEVGVLQGHRSAVSALVFAPDGSVLVSGGGSDILTWRISAGSPLQSSPKPRQ